MGEQKQKSRRREEILAGEPRCIYCDQAPVTVEHMPPVSIFRKRHRLSGLEFASCERCNVGTRAADATAAFMARLHPTNDLTDWRLREGYNLISAISSLAPEIIRELFHPSKSGRVWHRGEAGLLERARLIRGDGPILRAMMTVFAGKMGMALYREHVGAPLPLSGGVFTQFYFNAGLDRGTAEATLSIMPARASLVQGRSHSIEQFAYRYNCDDKTIFAALIGFHTALHIRVIATAEPALYDFLLAEYNADLVRPGELALRIDAALGSVRARD